MKRRIFSIFFALVLVLSMSLVTAVPAGAVDPLLEVWVDDGFTEATEGWDATHFDTIQEGIDAVDSGGIVIVAEGVYDEQVVITQSLTLQGVGDTTVIQPSGAGVLTTVKTTPWLGTGTYPMAAIVFVDTAAEVVVRDLKIDGSLITEVPEGATWVTGLAYLETSGTVESVAVQGYPQLGTRSCGIWASAISSASNVEVTECNVVGYNRGSIYACGGTLTVDFNNNEIYGPGEIVAQVPNGMFFLRDATGSATYNTITDLAYTGETYRSTGIGTYRSGADLIFGHNEIYNVQNAFAIAGGLHATIEYNDIHDCHTGIKLEAIGENRASNTNIQYNDIYDNDFAIRCGSDMGDGNEAHYNNFVGNLGDEWVWGDDTWIGAVCNVHETFRLDATHNWWGDASGPYLVNGVGDKTSPYVDTCVWLDAPYLVGETTGLKAGSTYSLHLLGYDPETVVYLDDIGADLLAPEDSDTGDDDNTYAASNDSFFITLDGNGDGTFTDVIPLYAGNSAYIGLETSDEEVVLEVWPSNYEGVEVTANVASFTYLETKAFIVTVTKDGAPLSGATVKIGIDYDADGKINDHISGTKVTGATGQVPFSITPTAAGLIIPEVYMDIGGTLGEPELPDGPPDIWNTACQIPINPIALAVTTLPTELLKSFETSVTVTAELEVEGELELFTELATYKLSAAFDIDPTEGVQKEMTTTASDGTGQFIVEPASAGEIAVTVSLDMDPATKVNEYLGTDTITVVEAGDLNVSVTPLKWDAGTYEDLVVTIVGSDATGPDGPASDPANPADHNLNWAKVVVSIPVGQSLATGNWAGEDTGDPLGNAVYIGVDTIRFVDVLPNDASSDITVTVTGELDTGTAVGPIIKVIPVSGYVVTDIMPDADQAVDDISDISLTVTTKEGVPVNSAWVGIFAEQPGGFLKDVTGDEELESFQAIFFAPWHGEIQYMTDPEGELIATEDFLVNNGYYEVTGIEFAQVGDVGVHVGAQEDIMASFPEAFTVLGLGVYSLTFEPITLTAGVDAADLLEITITDNSDPALDVETILIGGVNKDFTSVDNVYTIFEALLYTEADTLTVMAKNADETKYGTATLDIGLPAVSYVITDAADVERNVMLVGEAYTVTVTVTDALGEALANGKVSLGSYADTSFKALDEMPVELDGTGQKAIDIATADGDAVAVGDNPGTLVWKVGKPDASALVLIPAITVEAPEYTLDWTFAPIVDEEITFTVTDNYGVAAGFIEITIVTPGGIPIERVTTLEGVFKYTATEAGNYYVAVGEQDPVTVPVLLKRLESITASPSEVTFIVGGETQELIITATYSDGVQPDVTAFATYLSSDEDVVTVDAGVVTAVGEGEATITVTYIEGVITMTAEVSVTVIVWNPIDAYDDNDNGVIDKDEAVAAVWDYFDKTISKDQALEVLWLYFG